MYVYCIIIITSLSENEQQRTTKTYESLTTKGLMNNRCWERMFLGTKSPGNESSRKRMVPIGTFLHSLERKVLGMKSPGTHMAGRVHSVSQNI